MKAQTHRTLKKPLLYCPLLHISISENFKLAKRSGTFASVTEYYGFK